MKILNWTERHLRVLHSPKFWGIVLYSLLQGLLQEGILSGATFEMLTQIVLWATGVGVVDSIARKVGKNK